MRDNEFVETVLARANENLERRYLLKAQGFDFQALVNRVSDITGIDQDALLSGDRQRPTVQARSLFCCWAAEELGLKQPSIANRLRMTQSAVSMSIRRGKTFASENALKIN